MVIIFTKYKVAARKWIYTFYGKETNAKYKIECTTSFPPYGSTKKKENTEDLKFFFEKSNGRAWSDENEQFQENI